MNAVGTTLRLEAIYSKKKVRPMQRAELLSRNKLGKMREKDTNQAVELIEHVSEIIVKLFHKAE